MAGIMSPSMPVFVLENRTHGNKAYVTMNEGLGKCFAWAPSARRSSAPEVDGEGALPRAQGGLEHAVEKGQEPMSRK